MNVIFDLGGVVFDWNPQNLINRVTKNREEKTLLKKHLFDNSDWVKLDQGVITNEEVIKNTIKRSGLNRKLIEDVFKNVPCELSPKPETIKIIEELGKTDNNLYVLSNMHQDIAESLTRDYDFWSNFKGIVFSCDVKMVKPNSDIYEFILREYNLKPSDTIFIDDTRINLDEAEKHGISTIHFNNPDQLRSELVKLEVI